MAPSDPTHAAAPRPLPRAVPELHQVPRRPRLRRPGPQPLLAPGVLEHHRRPRRWPRLLGWMALAAALPALAWLGLR